MHWFVTSLIFIGLLGTWLTSSAHLTPAKAIYDPLSVPNNKVGVHVLDPSEVISATKLVNTSGGTWGYITVVIRSDDRDRQKWLQFFINCAQTKLIPIVRLATFFNGQSWVTPSVYDLQDFALFLNEMPWPTKNRYIALFNEPNHAAEWGGTIDPAAYASILIDAHKIFKGFSGDFFLLTGGLDMSAPNGGSTMDAYDFYRRMTRAQPSWPQSVDGLSMHAYANPAFSSSPRATNRVSIKSFDHERKFLKSLGIVSKPLFIKEAGYVGTGEFYTTAFSQVWDESDIVAVTPFLLFAGPGDFQKFSLLDQDHSPTPHYREIEALAKVPGSPLLSPQYSQALIESTSSPPPPNQQPVGFIGRIKSLFNRADARPVLTIGTTSIQVDLAVSESQKSKGLSGRTSLSSDEGMLFVFDSPRIQPFWMGGMLIPLDFIWINNGVVVDITPNVLPPAQTAGSPVIVQSYSQITHVLEVSSGFIAIHGIKVGDAVELKP